MATTQVVAITVTANIPVAGDVASALLIPHLFAEQVVTSGNFSFDGNADDISIIVGDVQIETTTQGASALTITIIDPDLSFINSGFFDADEEGNLTPIDIPYDGGWYRLTQIQPMTAFNDANVTLLFEDRIVSEMRDLVGPKKATRGPLTRAQFIKGLADTVHGDTINFVCRELDVVQPITNGTQKYTDAEKKQKRAKTISRRTPLDAAAKGTTKHVIGVKRLIVNGSKSNVPASGAGTKNKQTVANGPLDLVWWDGSSHTLTPAEIANANRVLDVAESLNAGGLATTALVEACIVESPWFENPSGGTSTSEGILQLLASTAQGLGISALDIEACCHAFLTKGFTGQGGAIAIAKAQPNLSAGTIAQMCQGSAYPLRYGECLGAAQQVITAYGGSSSGALSTSTQTAYEFTVGTVNTPNETYWDASQRLAQEVNWLLFSDRDTLYYMTPADLIVQGAVATVDVQNNHTTYADGSVEQATVNSFGGTWDVRNTATECQLSLICPVDSIHAGDAIILRNAGICSTGPYGGKWIVTDCVRSTFNIFSLLTLDIPGTTNLPNQLDEPSSNDTSVDGVALANNAAVNPAATGTRAAIVAAAQWGLAHISSMSYDEVRPLPASLFGTPANPCVTDCSGFVILCYKAAGAPDPSGNNYDGSGNTSSLAATGTQTKTPQPGDVCLYGASVSATVHATLYIGGGQCISFGRPGSPEQLTADADIGGPFIGYFSYGL
jgi:cell wall-associated NlpC family hydrolase